MKKPLSVVAILFVIALFPISFSGSQTASALSEYLIVTEGESIIANAKKIVDGVTFQWMIDNEICTASTAAKYGVEISGETTDTLTIKNINKSLNNKTLYYYYPNFSKMWKIRYKTIQVIEYKPVIPTITDIQSMTVNKNEECKITAYATASDGGLLSYQWYEASAENTREITPIEGATSSVFTCDTSKGGTRYYQCKVTNTNKGKTESAFSNIATVTVNTPVPTPNYNINKASINPGETVELKVTLSLSDSEKGKITYQWYESSKNHPDDAKTISGATAETYTVSGNAHSGTTYYYFCKITNELNGEKYTGTSDGMEMVEIIFAGQHVHEYGEWKVNTEPTCSENGTKTRACECGDKQQETISAPGHTYSEWAVKTAATENTEGQEERSCTKCGIIETRVIPIITVQSEISVSGKNNISVETSGQAGSPKTEWWIVYVVLGGAALGGLYGFILTKKNKKHKTGTEEN